MITVDNSDGLPKKSILRKPHNQNMLCNENKSSPSMSTTDNLSQRRVHFTHIDSYEFDPTLPCHFTSLPQRELFYSFNNSQQMLCLCNDGLKANPKTKSKIKLQHQ